MARPQCDTPLVILAFNNLIVIIYFILNKCYLRPCTWNSTLKFSMKSMWYCCHKNITWNPTLKSCMKKIHVCFFQKGKKKSTWSLHDIVTIRVSNHIYVRLAFWAYTHPTPFHFANYFLATWTRCCMERWCAPPQSVTNGIEVKVDNFCAQEKVECFDSFSSSMKHYETMRSPFSPICWRTFRCSPLILLKKVGNVMEHVLFQVLLVWSLKLP
jgi:hypothetical protein